jgi:type VI secretion system protein ImpA
MSEELQQPAVVDLDALLEPIPGENPSGESLRYSGLYDEIGEARRQDENLEQGAWQTELKVADYRRVIDLVVPALTSRTKDLQISVWLTEALAKQHGWVGLRDGLRLLIGLQDRFWDTLYPEIDEGDMEGRANAIGWLDTQGIFVLKAIPFTGATGYGYFNWEDSKKFDIPDSMDGLPSEDQKRYQSLLQQAESERRVTSDLWRKEVAATRRAPMEQINSTLGECRSALVDLNRVVEEKFDRNQAPSLGNFMKALDEIQSQVTKLVEEKRIEEPDPVEEEAVVEGEVSGDGTGAGKAAAGSATGPIQSRKEALKRLADIAAYFHRTEPHSPVSYLVQRAVKWGNMPLETWLQDVIKDDAIISQLRQTLGFNTNEDLPEG